MDSLTKRNQGSIYFRIFLNYLVHTPMTYETTPLSIDFQARPEMMILTNLADGAFTDVNTAFLNMLELDRSEIIGKNPFELPFLTQKDREILDRCVQTRIPIQDYEIVVRSKTGSVVVGLLSCNTLRIENEPCLVTTLVDITKQKYDAISNQKLNELNLFGICNKLVKN